jgi:hypothetical protein
MDNLLVNTIGLLSKEVKLLRKEVRFLKERMRQLEGNQIHNGENVDSDGDEPVEQSG